MNPPADLVEIPPLARTVIYYSIAVALIVCGAVVAGATGWNLALAIANGLGVLFFGTAAAKVSATREKKKTAEVKEIAPTTRRGA
jgi:hypothetical protein